MRRYLYPNALLWDVIQCAKRSNYVFPQEVARLLGITRMEAFLALQLGVEYEHFGRRRDGRFYFIREEQAA